ncbi:hypothetical protein C4D60_Mb02t20020 [Musa balbisiana]|uniref:Uncharacterized protein n=1 Tax=Musa balbisiana TaxID=52838 RepID=A0A4S8IED2_MUSBA|nr:hypothetical protein C4D60_Mb02t20020 [Musa balbisiana]
MMRSASHPLVHQRAVISIRLDVNQWCVDYPMLISDSRLVEVGVRGEEVALTRPLEKLIPDAISDQAKGLVILTAVNVRIMAIYLGPVERMVPGFHHLPSLFIWFGWETQVSSFLSLCAFADCSTLRNTRFSSAPAKASDIRGLLQPFSILLLLI